MRNYFDVSSIIVIFTGGMGQLGRNYGLALLDQDARGVVVDNNIDDSRIAVRFGDRASSQDVVFLGADITERRSLEDSLDKIVSRLGPTFGLINDPALDAPPNVLAEENGPFETYLESTFDKVMDVNVEGVFLCCQVFGAVMAEEGRGSIVNIYR